jgi:hypothetical protein
VTYSDEGYVDFPTFPARAGNFSLIHRVQTGSRVHPASYALSTGVSFLGGKAAGA